MQINYRKDGLFTYLTISVALIACASILLIAYLTNDRINKTQKEFSELNDYIKSMPKLVGFGTFVPSRTNPKDSNQVGLWSEDYPMQGIDSITYTDTGGLLKLKLSSIPKGKCFAVCTYANGSVQCYPQDLDKPSDVFNLVFYDFTGKALDVKNLGFNRPFVATVHVYELSTR